MADKKIAGPKPTSGLFKQLSLEEDKGETPYDLDTFKEGFIESADFTGYSSSQILLTEVPPKKRWEEWKRIFKNTRMRKILEDWIDELDIIIRSQATKDIINGCDSKDFPRLRYIKEGKVYGDNKVGRPSKEQISRDDRIKRSVESNIDKAGLTEVISLGEKR